MNRVIGFPLAVALTLVVSQIASDAAETKAHRTLLKGGVSHWAYKSSAATGLSAFAIVHPQHAFGTPNTPILVTPTGDMTTMIPANFLPQTGVNGPADGGASYTPEYRKEMADYLGRVQLMGPMSIIQSGNLAPSVLGTKDTLVNGVPQRVSGSVVMERPGYYGFPYAHMENTQVASRRSHIQIAARHHNMM
jgi:hypothetical protein